MADETTEQQEQQQPSEGSQLRQELESTKDENKELKDKLRSYAYRDVGLDPEKGVGKLVAQTYDGPAEPDAIRQWMSDNEINVNTGQQEQQQKQETGSTSQPRELTGEEQETAQVIGRIGQMQNNSGPVEGSKVSKDDWYQLSKTDPGKAQELFNRGLVDLPPHLANELSTG